jgi:5-hydroxyisourate hydrolase-like protein (transthyretin family)
MKPIWILTCATALALGVTSVATGAVGDPVLIGKRNAAVGQTAMVGTSTTYATRQSNNQEGDGGAASYGCRAPLAAEPCLFVLNHRGGEAFYFRSRGGESAGFIEVIPAAGKTADDVRPFTTNATGVATGLNADEVDGKSATDLVSDAVTASQPRLALVNAAGTEATGRGLAQAAAVQKTGTGTYTVTFASDVSKCAFSATQATTTDAGAAAAAPATGTPNAVTVVTRAGGGTDGTEPTAPADRPFHLVVDC